MKILVYTSVYRLPHEAYGAPFTEQLVRALQKLTDVTVVCPTPWYPKSRPFRFNPKWSALAGVPARCVMDGIEVFYPKYPMIPKFSGMLQPSLQAVTSLGLIRKLQRSGKIDIINARWIYPDGVAAAWIGRRLRIPVVLSALGCDINLYSTYRVRGAQIRWALAKADHITTVSQPLAEKVIRLGVDPARVTCELNGVDLDRFRVRDASDIPMSAYLLAVARLSEEKGIPTLVQALHILKRREALTFRTIIIGDGPQKARLQEDISRCELTHGVSLIGAVAHSQVDAWMRNAYALCLPSLREGMPNAVLEALASGLPVVASRVGGIPDIINATNGLMVEPGSAENLADALQLAFARKWDARQIRASVENMSWAHAAAVQMDIFRRVLSNAARRQGQ
jgi:glycosyltransferase involved in cell wall biosynthesis